MLQLNISLILFTLLFSSLIILHQAPNGSPSAAGYWPGPHPPPPPGPHGSMPPPAMYPPGMYPPPHMFGSAAAGPYTMNPPTPQGKPPADVVGKTEEGIEKAAEKTEANAKKEGDNPAGEVKAAEEKVEESKEERRMVAIGR